MHDYNTIKAIHQDRMAQFEGEADSYRLVRTALGQRSKPRGWRGVTALLASVVRLGGGVGAAGDPQLGDDRRVVVARRPLG